MTSEQNGQNGPAELSVPVLSNQQLSFEILLEDICERLQDTRQQGSLKRIRKMEETLDELEKELEELEELLSMRPLPEDGVCMHLDRGTR